MTVSAVCTTTACLSPPRSTGKERDAESGNDYFQARYYNSSVGRFLSPDWSVKEEPVPYAKLDDPQSLNLYAYVLNNPLSHVDTDGHKLDCSGDNAKGAGCQFLASWNADHDIDPDKKASSQDHKGKSVRYKYDDGSQIIRKGSHPYRDNNPGNEISGDGAIGDPDRGFVVFDSQADGFNALADDLSDHGDDTILDNIVRRTPRDDHKNPKLKGNDPDKYAKEMGERIHAPVSTKISKLTPLQFTNLVIEIAKKEGYFDGDKSTSYIPPPAAPK